MRRVVTRYSVFALLAACSSTGTLNSNNTAGHVNADHAQRITLASSTAPADQPPALVTLRGQGVAAGNTTAAPSPGPTGGTVYDVSTVAGAVRRIPPGGYVVRSTNGMGTSGTTATTPPAA